MSSKSRIALNFAKKNIIDTKSSNVHFYCGLNLPKQRFLNIMSLQQIST